MSFATVAKGGDHETQHQEPRVTADAFTVTIATSRNEIFNRYFVERLRKQLGAGYVITTLAPDTDQTPQGDLVITLGASALHRGAGKTPHPPLLALLVNENTFSSYTEKRSATGAEEARKNMTALFSDPPLVRQALLGLQILPHATHVAVLARPETAQKYQALARALQPHGLELRVFTVESADHLVATLIRALNFGDFLLGTPDPGLYNRQTIKPILLTTYRQNRILIGPEVAFVKAGALASTYTPASALTDQAVSVVRSFRASGQLPPPAATREFKVKFNQQVADSLNIVLPDTAAVVRKLEAAESPENKHKRGGSGR